MKKVAGKMKGELSQYRDLAAFAQFGSELDADTQKTLARGERLVELLKQNERNALSVADQVASIYAGTGGFLDRIATERVQEFLEGLLIRLHTENADLCDRINETGQFPEEDEKELSGVISGWVDDFGPDFDDNGEPIAAGESDRVDSAGSAPAASASADESSEEEAAAAV
jgi:F-type H+-transporting ATPase subunit alpha